DFSAQHWAQYEWSAPVTVSSASVWFWNDEPDPGNVRNPVAWTLQSWDSATQQFVDVPGEYPLPTGETQVQGPVTVSFQALSTTKLRLVLDAEPNDESFYSVAVTEWQVMGTMTPDEPEPVDPSGLLDLEKVHIRTAIGTAPEMPDSIWVLPENGPLSHAPVTWPEVEPSSYADEGEFTVKGTLSGGTDSVEAVVQVLPELSQVIERVETAATITTPGVAPVCPRTVMTTYADGSTSSRTPATWDVPDAGAYAEAESFGDIQGRVDGSGEAALCTFFVVEPVDTDDQAPAVSLSMTASPASSGWYVETPFFTVDAQERTSPVESVEYSTDGGQTWNDYAEGTEVAVDLEGEVTLQARATDSEGRQGSASRQVKVDTRAPETLLDQEDSSDGTFATITLTGTDPEPGSGVNRVLFSSGPSEDPTSSANDMWATYEGPFSVTRRTVAMYVHVHAQDGAGNEESTRTLRLEPLTEPVSPDPTIALSSPEVKQGGTLTVTGSDWAPGATLGVALGELRTTAEVGDDGSFSVILTIPSDAPSRATEVVVTDASSGTEVRSAVTVVAASNPPTPDPGGPSTPEPSNRPDAGDTGSSSGGGGSGAGLAPTGASALTTLLGAVVVLGATGAFMTRSRRR
ncbi:MAG: Ig-like domain-containing protein, partial [Propionibacterium sp.]|nr:Ig-like domain-containing protein [Propionibacterium sp.]